MISQTTTGRLNVRTEPNATSAKIGEAAAGQQYPLFDEADGWYRIQLSELLAGWVSATYASVVEVPVTPDGSLAAPSTPTSTVEVVKPQPIGRIRVRSTDLGYLNVRSGPGTGNGKVGEASVGSEYDLLAETKGWYQIQLNKDTIGWVSSLYVDKLQ